MQELKQLIESGSDELSDFIGTVVAATREHLGADIAFLTEFRRELKVIKKLAASGRATGVEEGAAFNLKDTYCHRLARGELPNIITDAGNDDRVKDLSITARLDIGAYVGVPVILPDGRTFGTLCCIFHDAEGSLHARDVKFMHVLAKIVGNHLGRQARVDDEREAMHGRIRSAIEQDSMKMVFQPIVDIATRGIVGAEALARFDAEPRRTPDLWFAEATEVGLGRELEIAAVRLALAALHRLPGDAYLSVNVSPDTLVSDDFFDALATADPARIVAEVTEHAVVKDYESLIAAVRRLHGTGARLAVDDVGVGYSGIGHIIRVAPKILKLDLSLTRDVHRDVIKQALATSTVAFASRVGMDIVAEGIETAEDADTLRQLGVRYGQGYHYGKPGQLPLTVT